ncbi:prepilin-type N-terminal cleavage/methylation domain-containing protein [bacterium]|nr:prepilin-type N-terminal cleavage/methylation domain-containing protein [bacterium]
MPCREKNVMKQRAFTLIELLIVVAIIGILAAIAVPNFMNAQTRAKISRELSDMKAISMGVQQIRLDTGHLLIDCWDDDVDEGDQIVLDIFKGVGYEPDNIKRHTTHILAPLTSPVSYLSSIPTDPFLEKNPSDVNQRGFGSALTTYLYVDFDPHVPLTGSNSNNMNLAALELPVCRVLGIQPLKKNEFAVVGVGPDARLGSAAGINPDRGVPYDASNGLRSVGDVYMRNGGGVNN